MTVFSLSFLDAMTCGLGAVVLLFMVINANMGVRTDQVTADLQSEVDRIEDEVLDGYKDLVELRNSLREIEEEIRQAAGLSRRIIENMEEIQVELATYENDTLSRREHINRLKADLKSLEEEAKRLAAATPSEETPGSRTRAHLGDGDRQYLTGLKVGGERIFILVDTSASMLGETLVNVIRRRNLPDKEKARAAKWRQAVATVDWLTTQIPRSSKFQIYTFSESAGTAIPGTEGKWLDGKDKESLDKAVGRLKGTVPEGGTSLYHAFQAAMKMSPRPDNLILLTDGLPTRGKSKPGGRMVTGKQRAKLFRDAVGVLEGGLPINVILFPMEGDPMAPSAYWRLALATRGSYLNPSKDWP
jgi:Mg-chelatase subunit ChlD